MNTNTGIAATFRRLRGSAVARFAALALVVGSVASIGAYAHDGGHFMHGFDTSDPAALADHIHRFTQHVYIEIGATPQQQAQLDPLLTQAATDLIALHARGKGGHEQAVALLTADTIDRDALETFRVEHMRLADDASRRIVQLIGDVAQVLRPEQRRTLAARIAERHAWAAAH